MYKTLRKVLLLFLITTAIVCGTLFAVACGGKDDDDEVVIPELAAPTGVDIDDDGILSWNLVSNASGYIVYDGNSAIKSDIASDVHSYDLNDANLAAGNHSISVAAKGDGVNYKDSPKSSPAVPYTVGGSVGGDEADGSATKPYNLDKDFADNGRGQLTRLLEIDLGANESVYYWANLSESKTFVFSLIEQPGLVINVYSSPLLPAIATFEADSDGNLEAEYTVDADTDYYFSFSVKDGSAASYYVTVFKADVAGNPEPGTEDNPIAITSFGTYGADVPAWGGVYYQYVADVEVTLYFVGSSNAALQVYYVDDDGIAHYAPDDLSEGWSVNAGTVVTIILGTLDWEADYVTFIISDVPILDYVITVEDSFSLSGLKVELYVFDPEQPNGLGEKYGEADVISGTAVISAPENSYRVVLTGYDSDLYICEQGEIGKGAGDQGADTTEVTLTVVVKPQPVPITVTINGYDKLPAGSNIHLSVFDSNDSLVKEVAITSDSVTFEVDPGLSGFYGYVTILDLPDGYTVDQETINSEDEKNRSLYIVKQPTLDLDQDWVSVEVLSFKTLNFKLGSSVKTGVEYYIMIDPDSVLDEREFDISYNDDSTVRLTPQGNYWAAINFSTLKLSIYNGDTTTLELRFKLLSEKPATIVEEGGSVSLQVSNTITGEFTTGESVVDGNYILSLVRTDMMFNGTVTLYVGESDNTGYVFTCSNRMINPSSYKVHLTPGVVIRVVASNTTGVTITLAKALEGKELELSGYTETNINLSEETAGSSVVYTFKITATIGSDAYIFMKGAGMGAPLPVGVKVTIDFGDGTNVSADGSDYDQIYKTLDSSVGTTWTVTIDIAAGTNVSNLSFLVIFDPGN